MRQRILTLGLILAARTLLAQEAVNRDSIGAGQTPAFAITAPVSGNTWIDLRQNAKPGAVQSVPDWVEAVTFIPADAQTNAAATSVSPNCGLGRIRFAIAPLRSSWHWN